MAYSQNIKILEENPALFRKGIFGLEKENLRIDQEGKLAQTNHPVKKTDIYRHQIVRDFAESQVEFITKPVATIEKVYQELACLQDHFLTTYQETLWPLSMPCQLEDGRAIRIAQYDESKKGKEESVYREGLANRHGKKMQLISGIHYNFSFGEEVIRLFGQGDLETSKNEIYFHVARNVIRNQWMLTYLYGASPLVDASYEATITQQLTEVEHCCQAWEEAHTYYGIHATSLRMSRYGYHCNNQEKLAVSYNSLEDYVQSIKKGMGTEIADYVAIGLENKGKLVQLNTNLLQRESEYYAPVRFKQTKQTGETKLDYLTSHGVAYIELRLFDLNPYAPYGISKNQLYLTHLFILDTLFQSSPPIDQKEKKEIYENNQKICLFGRSQGQVIYTRGKKVEAHQELKDWLNRLERLALLLDGEADVYRKSVEEAKNTLRTGRTLSKQMVEEVTTNHLSFIQQGLNHIIKEKSEKRGEA